ncbi:MAG: PorT family protein [Bacteroidetes bacterium]|nr:PorT family protein [Bacteroidota bacterium]
MMTFASQAQSVETREKTQADEFQLGLKTGANIFEVVGKAFDEQFRFGYHLGTFMYVNTGEGWGIQAELVWSNINTKLGSNLDTLYDFNNISDISLNYLSVPILVSYSPVEILSLQSGPQFGILINPHETTLKNGANAFTDGDFSWLLGAQVNLGPFKGGLRYVIGLNNINDITDRDKWANNGLQIYVGLRIF